MVPTIFARMNITAHTDTHTHARTCKNAPLESINNRAVELAR